MCVCVLNLTVLSNVLVLSFNFYKEAEKEDSQLSIVSRPGTSASSTLARPPPVKGAWSEYSESPGDEDGDPSYTPLEL
jgi:hypothetical protein